MADAEKLAALSMTTQLAREVARQIEGHVPQPTGTPLVTLGSGSYTLKAENNNGVISTVGSSAISILIPAGLPLGFKCDIVISGTGMLSLNTATGVTITSQTGGDYDNTTPWLTLRPYALNSYLVSNVP